ncbi:cytochrome c [Sphingomonas sp. DBB INV C78]|uniref:c-type cytochrome n=1 Tax=Sphingomonas sp. DBB INV C78 TaxID=3349434 RepID=UPI0036D25CFE
MKPVRFSILALAALPLAACGGEKQAGPADAVAICATCHTFNKGGMKRTGPNLHGIVGATAGSQPGFTYSGAMKDSGITWTPETLDAFIAAPGKLIPGNRMGFAGEPDAAKRKAIIAWLRDESTK